MGQAGNRLWFRKTGQHIHTSSSSISCYMQGGVWHGTIISLGPFHVIDVGSSYHRSIKSDWFSSEVMPHLVNDTLVTF